MVRKRIYKGILNLRPRQLLEAAESGQLLGLAAWLEMRRRIGSVKSSRLALSYLLAEDDTDRVLALDGLMAICWRAKGNFCIPLNRRGEPFRWHDGRDRFDNVYWATRRFILDILLEFLAKFRDADEGGVILAALNDKFRYIPRMVQQKIIDRVRKVYHNREPVVNALSLDFKVKGEESDGIIPFASDLMTFDSNEYSSTLGTVRLEPMVRNLLECTETLRSLMGERLYAALCAAIEVYQNDPGDDRREHKGRLTAAIAKRRHVSPQQARRDKVDLQRFMNSPATDSARREIRSLLERDTRPASFGRSLPRKK